VAYAAALTGDLAVAEAGPAAEADDAGAEAETDDAGSVALAEVVAEAGDVADLDSLPGAKDELLERLSVA
jgi:hypothetical protein